MYIHIYIYISPVTSPVSPGIPGRIGGDLLRVESLELIGSWPEIR